MYSIKNLLQSAQLRQALSRKGTGTAAAPQQPWISGNAFMGRVPPSSATQMQYAAPPAYAGENAAAMSREPMPAVAPVPPQWNVPLQSPMTTPGMVIPAQQPMTIPQSVQPTQQPMTIPQSVQPAQHPQMSQGNLRTPPQIPPQLPTPVVKSGSIYRDLMKKHDRFTQRHLEPSATYDKVKGGAHDSK